MSDYQELRASALEALGQGDAATAFYRLRGALSWPGPAEDAALFDALTLMSQVVAPMAGPEIASLFASAGRGPDPRRLRDLGHGLMDMGLPDVAATLLERCRRLAPDQERVLLELVSALDALGASGAALSLLKAAPAALARSGALRHALAAHAAQTGDLDAARGLLDRLGAPEDDEQRLIQAWLQRVHIRAQLTRPITGLDPSDLRGWQYALTGTTVLHLSEHGHPEPMGGRYAWVQDTPDTVRICVERLRAALRAAGEPPPALIPLPDRDSEILALAAGALLDLPVRPWPVRGVPAPALLVAYDLREAAPAALASLFQRAPGQILWSHVGCWTEAGPIAPDIVSFLAQYAVSSWGERLAMNPDTQEVEHRPADLRPAEAIAAEIAALPAPGPDEGPLDDVPGLEALARADLQIPARRPRERWTLGSPVSSNRFT